MEIENDSLTMIFRPKCVYSLVSRNMPRMTYFIAQYFVHLYYNPMLVQANSLANEARTVARAGPEAHWRT